MCLFSFEPGNCSLPRANETEASKDLSSICNSEPSNSLQAPQLNKIHRITVSHTTFMYNCGQEGSAHLRIFLQRKDSTLKGWCSDMTLFAVTLIIFHMPYKVREIKQEEEREIS